MLHNNTWETLSWTTVHWKVVGIFVQGGSLTNVGIPPSSFACDQNAGRSKHRRVAVGLSKPNSTVP